MITNIFALLKWLYEQVANKEDDMAAKGNSSDDFEHELTKLRVEYWTKRLDHTLTHTQTASQLIYLIDGAVLALLYFVIGALGTSRYVIGISAFPILVLVILNCLHSQFVLVQRYWYWNIDKKLREQLKVDGLEELRPKIFDLHSAHGIYRAIHIVIATSLFILGIAMLLYSFGVIPEIVEAAPTPTPI